jgi:ribose transport system permease protein
MKTFAMKEYFNKLKKNFWTVYGIPVALVIICIFLAFTTKSFATVENILNILRQISIISIVATGTTLILISGGIDISMGSVMALSGITCIALITKVGVPYPIAILASLAVGCLSGLLNGLLITKVKIPPFIATLGTMQILRGIGFVYTGGYSLYGDTPKQFVSIGRGYLGIIPVPVIIMVIIYIIFFMISNYSKIGFYTYALGNNEKAAKLSGINVIRLRLLLYTLGGVMSAIAGVIITARLNSAQAGGSSGIEFDILTAVVLGGTSMSGGKGKIQRTLLGAIVIGVISNGMTLLNVNAFYQMIASGGILIIALALDRIKARD